MIMRPAALKFWPVALMLRAELGKSLLMVMFPPVQAAAAWWFHTGTRRSTAGTLNVDASISRLNRRPGKQDSRVSVRGLRRAAAAHDVYRSATCGLNRSGNADAA